MYLDYNATTPVDRRVIDSMIPIFEEHFGNPSSSSHETGRIADSLVDGARSSVANIVGMRKSDVIFTSGATEANNMVFSGFLPDQNPSRILVGATEHKSVLEPCRFLSDKGTHVEKIPVTPDGILDLDMLDEMLSKKTDIVSVMAANSETGVIHPISDVVKRVHEHGALIHCDATQAIGKIPFDAEDIDIITFSSHKIYGPMGCGAFVATREVRRQMQGILYGGGQESNLRSGTLNVPAIVGFGKACEIARNEGLEDSSRQTILRDDFERRIVESIPNVSINACNADRLPNTSNIRIAGAVADAVIVNAPEIEISTGSACSSTDIEPSHVLLAMGLDSDAANESVRISLGRTTTRQDMDVAVNAIVRSAQFVRNKEAEISERLG